MFLLALLLAGEITAPAHPPQPIVGGEPTVEGEWDGVVAFLLGTTVCSGTVVAPRLVLTAAHCVHELDPDREPESIYYGPRIDPDKTVPVVDWGAHPRFCYETACDEDIFDFGYLVLGEDVEINTGFVRPLATQREWDQTMGIGRPVTVVGYGIEDSPAPGRKRRVTMAITGGSTLGVEFDAGGDGRDACTGDSGGPALVRNDDGEWLIAGVTSRGSKPCGDGGTYGLAAAALVWLEEETGVDLNPPGCEGVSCLDFYLGEPPSDGSLCRVGGDPSDWPLLTLPGVLLFRRRPD